MINKKDKPNKKKNRPDSDRDFIMSSKRYDKKDRQGAEDDIEYGLEKWRNGEYEE